MCNELIWSSEYDEQLCENIHDCEHCDVDCHYSEYYENGHYDTLNDIIDEDFHMYFGDNKGFDYFVIDDSYEKIVDGKIIKRYSDVKGDLKSVCDWISSNCGQYIIRIYKGKYNHIIIELSHHDGDEFYQLCRLNKVGQDYYDKYYDFDYTKYAIKGVLKDFDYFNQK